jgi:hypothetical protein
VAQQEISVRRMCGMRDTPEKPTRLKIAAGEAGGIQLHNMLKYDARQKGPVLSGVVELPSDLTPFGNATPCPPSFNS